MISNILYISIKIKKDYENIISKESLKLKITKPEADVLLFFYNNNLYHNACDAEECRGFSKAYISKAIDNLKKRQYIEIEKEQEDRRYQKIIISDKGKEIAKSLQRVQREYFKKLTNGISKDDAIVFKKCISKIISNSIDQFEEGNKNKC